MIWMMKSETFYSGMLVNPMSDKPTPFIEFYTDGSSRGKNGASYSFICIKNGEIVFTKSEILPNNTTSGEAEYIAILKAIRYAKNKKFKNIIVNTDSESIAWQMNGNARVKAKSIKRHYFAIKNISDKIGVTFNHVPRNNIYTGLTDGLCDLDMDFSKRCYRKY